MDIRKIESIYAVVIHGNYTDAAFYLNSSPSVIAKHILSAEEELGISIFSRASRTKTAELTPDGEKIIPYFREILLQYNLALKEIEANSINSISKLNQLTIGYCPRVGSFGEHKILANLQLTAHNLVISRKTGTIESLIDNLIVGKIDALFLPLLEGSDTPTSQYSKLNNENIAILEIMHFSKLSIGLPFDHRLAEYAEIPTQEFPSLRNEVFIMATTGMNDENALSILTTKLGICGRPKIRYVDYSEQTLALELVKAGAGLLPIQTLVPEQIGQIRFIPLEGSSGSCITLYLIYQKDNANIGVKQMVNFIQKNAQHIYRDYPYVVTPFGVNKDSK